MIDFWSGVDTKQVTEPEVGGFCILTVTFEDITPNVLPITASVR